MILCRDIKVSPEAVNRVGELSVMAAQFGLPVGDMQNYTVRLEQ